MTEPSQTRLRKALSGKRLLAVGIVALLLLFAGCSGGGGTTTTTAGAGDISNDTTTDQGDIGGADTTAETTEEETTEGGVGTNDTTEGGRRMTATTAGGVSTNETTTDSVGMTDTTEGGVSMTETTTGGSTSMAGTTSMAETMTPEVGSTMTQTEAGGVPQTTVAGTSVPALSGTPSGPNDDQFYLSVLEIAFNQSDRNISFVSAETQEDVVALRYVTAATNESSVLYETAFIGGTYAGVLDEGWSVDRLNVTAVTSAGDPVRTFYIESSWARQYMNEEISTEEFISQIRGTVETQSNATGPATGTNSTA